MFRLTDLPDRLANRIMPTIDGCWLWMAYTQPFGYGRVKWNGHTREVHRVVYSILKGPLVDGLEIDHLCRQPSCCNPAHLEQVPHRVNVARGAAGAHEAAKTHCPRGHAYAGANLTVDKAGGRRCRTCKSLKKRKVT